MESFSFNYHSNGIGSSRDVNINIDGSHSFEILMQEFETFLNACGYHRGYAEQASTDNMATPYDNNFDDVTAETLSSYENYTDSIKDSPKKKLEDAIYPFLENLMKNPDKILMRWPNRQAIVESKIKEIENILENGNF